MLSHNYMFFNHKIGCLAPCSIELLLFYCKMYLTFYLNVEPEGKYLYTETIKLYYIVLYKTKGERAFSHFGPSIWNSLPSHIRNAATITTFKSALKTHYFSMYHYD